MAGRKVELSIGASLVHFSSGNSRLQLLYSTRQHTGILEHRMLNRHVELHIYRRINGQNALPNPSLRPQVDKLVTDFALEILSMKDKAASGVIHRSVELPTS